VKSALLDESMPRQIARPLCDAGFVVATVEEAGLKGADNGRLLRAARGVSTCSSTPIGTSTRSRTCGDGRPPS
jgi:hypothetical protein